MLSNRKSQKGTQEDAENVGRAPFRGPRGWGLPSDPRGGSAAQWVLEPPGGSTRWLLGVLSAGEAGGPRRCRTGPWTERPGPSGLPAAPQGPHWWD